MYKFVNGDALSEMQRFPDGHFDLIITSPPYNMRKAKGNPKYIGGKWNQDLLISGYDTYSDNLPESEYIDWQRECLKEMLRLIPDNGAIFYNHKWRIQNGLLDDRKAIVDGFPVRQIIIWQKAGGVNFQEKYFLPTYEVIYMIAKPDFKLLPKANSLGDIWNIPQDSKNPHPASFPLALPDRIIRSTSAKMILDPFMGSGTTAIAAYKNRRDFIGIEMSKKYCDIAEARLNEYKKNICFMDYIDFKGTIGLCQSSLF